MGNKYSAPIWYLLTPLPFSPVVAELRYCTCKVVPCHQRRSCILPKKNFAHGRTLNWMLLSVSSGQIHSDASLSTYIFCFLGFIMTTPSWHCIPLTLISPLALLFEPQVCPRFASSLHSVIFHFTPPCSCPPSFCYHSVLYSFIYRAALIRCVPVEGSLWECHVAWR